MRITLAKEREGRHKEREKETLTIIAAPVYVDAASIVAGELSEGETCGVCCGQKQNEGRSVRTHPKINTFEMSKQQIHRAISRKLTK